jgi:KipI family sensor histidine kinase inhibitor
VRISAASDRSILVAFGDQISTDAIANVSRLTRALVGVRGILNLHPAYASVLVDFDPRLRSHDDIEAIVRDRLAQTNPADPGPVRTLKIAVSFGGEDGPDLADVAQHTGFAPDEVIERFAAAEFTVYFVGFATCFPYLGGLPSELATPRLSAPRKLVAAGSVAIGGAQCGVYPLPSPGGWRLIGRTELRLFNPDAAPPALLRMGDRLRFVPS